MSGARFSSCIIMMYCIYHCLYITYKSYNLFYIYISLAYQLLYIMCIYDFMCKLLPKEVWRSNFRQYGQMEKQRWEESEKRKAEERRSEKRCAKR